MSTTTPLPRSRPPRGVPLGAALAAAVLLLVLVPAASASAHDVLLSSSPAAGATVSRLDAVTLTFEDPLVELGAGRNGIVVTGPGGRHFETACATVSGDVLTIPVAPGAGGAYRVEWRGVSQDGHIVGNTYTFTYRPATGAKASAGSASGPSCGALGDTSSGGVETARSGGGAIAILIGAVSGGVLLVVVAVLVVVVLRLRRTGGAE